MAEPWEVGSWRLSDINKTGAHCFSDARDLVDWMKNQVRTNDGMPAKSEEEIKQINLEIKQLIFEVVTSESILKEVKRFTKLSPRFKIRVQWFFDQGVPLEYEMQRA